MAKRWFVAMMGAALLMGACGGGGGPQIETSQIEAALAESRSGIDALRVDGDQTIFDEATTCVPRNSPGTIAEAVAAEVNFDIFSVERYAGAFASDSGRLEANVCDWLDFESEDRAGVVGLGLAHGPLGLALDQVSADGWDIDGEAREISRSEALDPIQDGELWFTCIDFESEDIEDVCELVWGRAELAVMVYVYSEGGAPPVDPQVLAGILDEQLPAFVAELAGA